MPTKKPAIGGFFGWASKWQESGNFILAHFMLLTERVEQSVCWQTRK